MKCPFCGSTDTKVTNSRTNLELSETRRRRHCESCNKRFSTIERIEGIDLFVIKRDNSRDLYSRKKLYDGIVKACNKRPISAASIDEIINNIEAKAFASGEIKSSDVGILVLNELINVDEIAYLRYASVCKNFDSIDTFLEEVIKIRDSRK